MKNLTLYNRIETNMLYISCLSCMRRELVLNAIGPTLCVNFNWFLQKESFAKQKISIVCITVYLLLGFQLINAITIQPYLFYKLRGNLKIVTFFEYISLFIITAAELFKVMNLHEFLDLDFQMKMMYTYKMNNQDLAIRTIQKHSSNIRKCMLTLITSDFYQLISNPIGFQEYMLLRNQISRYASMIAFTCFLLMPYYIRIIAVAVTTYADRWDIQRWMKYIDPNAPASFAYRIVETVLFHVTIIVLCSFNLIKIKQSDIEMKKNLESCKTNIRSLIFMVMTIATMIFIAFIIDLHSIIKKRNGHYTILDHTIQSNIPYWISLCYEGITGFVVTASLLVFFPQLRPIRQIYG